MPSTLRLFLTAGTIALGSVLCPVSLAAAEPPPFTAIYAKTPAATYYAFQPTMIAPASTAIQRRSEGSTVSLKNGNVLAAWCDLIGPSDNAKGYIVAQELAADGKPLGEPRVLFPTPEGGLNVLSPAVRRLKNGELGLAFSYRLGTKQASRLFSTSADEGKTWSATVLVSDGSDPYMTGCNDRLTVLESGRLVAPLHCTEDWDAHHVHVKVARSDDHGKTWQVTAQRIDLPSVRWPENKPQIESGCIEPGIAQRADGSLLMTIRTAMGTQFFSESEDQGETWSAPRSLELISPQAPANLSRIPGSNDLLMVWTPSYEAKAVLGGKRNTIMTAISKDGGRTWPHAWRKILIYDPEHSVDYPSVLYRGNEVWITLRMSSGPGVLQGLTSTQLVRVPLAWVEM